MAENFDLIFGQSASQQYGWSDSDYQKGWETVGSTPPTAAQFDALQRRADNKAKDLNDRLTPIETNNTNIFRQPSTTYALKDIRFYPELPAGWYFECKVDGTTDAGAITLPATIVENAEVTDGTVTWTIRKIGSGGGEAVGIIKEFAGNDDIPAGYLLCDGAAVSRTMFPDLFAAIGTTYGAGDGSTTFNVPDYNTAQRFAQGGTVAGVEKSAGLPNITGSADVPRIAQNNTIFLTSTGAVNLANSTAALHMNVPPGSTNLTPQTMSIDASNSSPIYGNSTTVQPPALTTRYIIKAFDGQTADSALIDITQYAQELVGKANITGSNLVHHRDVITTSGTYTAPVTGLYKITVKGGGGGGGNGAVSGNVDQSGGGGGEGGTTIAYEKLIAGDSVSVVIGAGGAGGAPGTDGGTTTANANNNTYTATGGTGGKTSTVGGLGGNGTINGASGTQGLRHSNRDATSRPSLQGGSGGGAGGGVCNTSQTTGVKGGGGAGGTIYSNAVGTGGNGGNGYVWFEYYTPGA